MTTLHRLILALTIAVLAAPALANDASYWGSGSSVFAYKEQRIRMVSEKIRIFQKAVGDSGAHWVADCTFEFKNLNDQEITIQMGFPDRGAFPNRAWTIGNFSTTIKGQPIPVTHKIVDPNHGRPKGYNRARLLRRKNPPKLLPLLPEDHDPDGWRAMARKAMTEMNLRFGAAYTWPVTFKPGETLIVKNRYTFGGASANGPITMCLDNNTMPKEKIFWYDKEGWTGFGSGPCSEAAYIVTTGRSWHGTIGEATIEFEIPAEVPPNHVIPIPPATAVTDRVVRWHYTDFEPTSELRVLFANTWDSGGEETKGVVDFTSVDQVRKWLAFGALNGFRKSVIRKMRDIQAYSFGLRPPGAVAPKVFDDFTHPKVKTARRLDALTSTERAILAELDTAIKTAK